MHVAILQLVAGVLLLYLGGEALVRGSIGLSARLGVRPLVAGLTIVAFGTSAPELVVTLDAAIEGYNDVAVGNVVGSNLCNIALILGVAALMRPIRVDRQLGRVDLPVLMGCTALFALLLLDDHLGRADGLLLLAALPAYVALHLWLARRAGREQAPAVAEEAPPGRPPLARQLLLVGGGLAALAAGGTLVVHGGVAVAAALGVSQALIALTVVAVGTSLPELSTSVVAALRSQGDIALGNIVGTNIFNLLAILGLTAGLHPLVRGAVRWTDVGAMCAATAALGAFAWTGRRLGRLEGAALLAGYVGFLAFRLPV